MLSIIILNDGMSFIQAGEYIMTVVIIKISVFCVPGDCESGV